MEVKISIVLSADPVLLAALQALSLGKSGPLTSTLSGADTPTPAKSEKKKVKEEAPASAESAKPSADTAAASVSSNGASHTLSSLRAIAVPLSKAGHKDAIKGWLKKAGFESINDLTEDRFINFYSYLQTLKA